MNEGQVRKAFEELEPKLLSLPERDLRRPHVRIRECVARVVAIARQANAAPWRERFEHLTKSGQWAIEPLDMLESSAQALWYVRHKLDMIAATESQPLLESELLSRALEHRARMRKVCEYCLDGVVEVQKTLQYLRAGQGFEDLADDLFGYATLYRDHGSKLTRVADYDPNDGKEAEQLSIQIREKLGKRADNKKDTWSNYQTRAFTFMVQCYDEVRAAGVFLARAQSDVDALFPSLFAIGRSSKTRKPAPVEPDPPDPAAAT